MERRTTESTAAGMRGQCLCGGIRFTVSGTLAPIQVCHCAQCRQAQGGPFATNVPVARSALRFDAGESLLRAFASSPGKRRVSCATCSSPIYSERDSAPEGVRLRAGLLDEPVPGRLAFHAWVGEKANWWPLHDDLPRYVAGADASTPATADGDHGPLHIGIVGCSAEGAALCYRTLCSEGSALLGPHAHPEISMHTPSLDRYVACLDRGDLDGVAALMLESARKLAVAGADFLVCPDNTIHQAMPQVLAHSPLPWLHIAQVVADDAVARGLRRVGVLGTHWLVDSDVYPRAFEAAGIDWRRPPPAVQERVGQLIMDELVYGRSPPDGIAMLVAAIAGLAADGCDAVVLGCTELPLVLDDANSPLPTLDSTRLLARAALRRAVGGRTVQAQAGGA